MHDQNIQISAATPEDIPQLVELLSVLFSIEADFTPAPEKQATGLGLLLADSARTVILVARHPEKSVIGMVTVQLVISTAQGSLSGWVEDMVIHQDFRRMGIGKKLLAEALDWAIAKGASRLQLLVDTNNLPAVAYYQALHWEPTQLQARRMLLK